MSILSDDGALAPETATAGVDPGSFDAVERIRRYFPPKLVAAALTQVVLWRRAREKLPMADRVSFTPDELEQATRQVVARWRAAWSVEAGINDVWDLGCGIGVDAVALAEVGPGTHAVKSNPATAALVRVNLALSGGGEVTVGRAEDVRVPEGCEIFLDPARRTAWSRTWDVADLTPSWSLTEDHLRGQRAVFAKLGPGSSRQLIPEGVGAA